MFGFEVDVDDDEAEALRRQGLTAGGEAEPTEGTVPPAAGFPIESPSLAAVGFEAAPADQPAGEADDTETYAEPEPDADQETTE